MKPAVVLILAAALFLGGCSGMSYTQQRVLSGGAIGAAIGAGAGLLGGYIYDQYQKSHGRPYQP